MAANLDRSVNADGGHNVRCSVKADVGHSVGCSVEEDVGHDVRSGQTLVTLFGQSRCWSRCSVRADVCHNVRSGQTFVTMFGQGRCWPRCSDKADVGHDVRTRQTWPQRFICECFIFFQWQVLNSTAPRTASDLERQIHDHTLRVKQELITIMHLGLEKVFDEINRQASSPRALYLYIITGRCYYFSLSQPTMDFTSDLFDAIVAENTRG